MSKELEALREAISNEIMDAENTDDSPRYIEGLTFAKDVVVAALASDVPTTEQPAMCSAEGIMAAHPACEPAATPKMTTSYHGCGEHATEWIRDCDECWNQLKENDDTLLDLVVDELRASEQPAATPTTDGGEGNDG